MKLNYFISALIILVIGICIGILTGLSVSPVIQSVITSIVTVIISVLSVWIGIKPKDTSDNNPLKYKIDILPIGIFIVGLTTGSLLGIYLRTHNSLSPTDISQSVTKAEKIDTVKVNPNQVTGLFSFSQNICEIINGYTGKNLIAQLRSLGNYQINTIIDGIGEDKPEKIKEILLTLCKN